MIFNRFTTAMLLGALATLPAACGPQPAGMAAPAPAVSLSGPANATPAATPMPGMAGMDHSNMQGMDMNTMMAHCAQMRQQARAGVTPAANMQQMMARCDQMDRSMGTPAARRR